MTIHQKIADAHRKNKSEYGMGNDKPMRSFDAPRISDIEEIKQVLQYILDKLHGMDAFMRGNMQAKHYREHHGEATKVQDPDERAAALGLPSINKLNDTITKELEKHANDSKETNSRAGEAPKQVPGSGSCANRQGDFRAGNTGNPTVEQKDSDNLGAKKIDDTPKARP